MKRLLRKSLQRMGYALFNMRKYYGHDGLYTVHDDRFRREPAFKAAYERGVRASRGVDPQFEWRVHIALWAATMARSIPGDFVECGVNAGFISSAIMRFLHWREVDKRFFLIDTFSGPVLSQFSEREISHGRHAVVETAVASGAYVTDMRAVCANFSEWPNAVVVQGVVPDILPSVPVNQIAFLHLDMNCAFPERAALEFFWDRLSNGAFVLFDDYGYFGHDAQTDAIHEAATILGSEVLSLPTGQGLIVKRQPELG